MTERETEDMHTRKPSKCSNSPNKAGTFIVLIYGEQPTVHPPNPSCQDSTTQAAHGSMGIRPANRMHRGHVQKKPYKTVRPQKKKGPCMANATFPPAPEAGVDGLANGTMTPRNEVLDRRPASQQGVSP